MNIKKIRPLFTAVVVTSEVYPVDYKEGNIISPKAGRLKEYQKVIAVGDSCRGISEGSLVCIDLSSYAVHKYKKNSLKSELEELNNEVVGYNVPQIKIDGKECMYLDIRDIKYEVLEYDVDKEDPITIVTPNNSIIL